MRRRFARTASLGLVLFLASAGCSGPSTASPPSEAPIDPGPAEPPPEAATAPALADGGEVDLSDPEGLVRAVFEALRSADEGAYLRMTPTEPEDFQALAALRRPPPPLPSAEEVEARRAEAGARFRAFVEELRGRGFDGADARLVEIRTDRARQEGDVGFAEDLTAVVESGGATIEVTLDDCILAPRGWLILDRLRLRD